jgi:hypothetical protein
MVGQEKMPAHMLAFVLATSAPYFASTLLLMTAFPHWSEPTGKKNHRR